MTLYSDLYGISKIQRKVMVFVTDWAKQERKPVPRSEILKNLKEQEIGEPSTINAINSLIKKRYIRRAVTILNKSYYVMLRGI